MTSQEIKSATEDHKSPTGWLKEIAYQLALLNEHGDDSNAGKLKKALARVR